MTQIDSAPDFRAFLSSFAENLSAHPPLEIYGREAEVAQLLQALASPLKGRVVIVGPPRVGKTAVAHTAAHAIARGQCPPELRGKEVWRFSPGGLPGLGQAGQWQAALEHLLQGWAAHPEIILFIEDLPRAARLPSGGVDDEGARNVDVAMLLAAGLKRQGGLCLAEAEADVWRRFAEAYPDYGRLFLPIQVSEPEPEAVRQIITRAAEDLGVLNGVGVPADAIEQ
ncbi:MAG: AAA family ATPase, partial [Anaerolineales bacterium]|nr:AAA family ATPase [Anaerolineales bacterium]